MSVYMYICGKEINKKPQLSSKMKHHMLKEREKIYTKRRKYMKIHKASLSQAMVKHPIIYTGSQNIINYNLYAS